LAPLSAVAKAELRGVMRRMSERIHTEATPEEAGTLRTATDVLMGLRYPRILAAQLLQGVLGMKEPATYQAIVEEGRAEGDGVNPIERDRFELIKRKHGGYSSWAVWAPATDGPKSNVGDLSVLDPTANPTVIETLKGAVVMVGLNISRSFDEPFRNFHDQNPNANDFKLRFAFTGTPYYGAYMTDVVKHVPMVKSADLIKYLREHPSVIDSQIATFRDELRDLGCAKPTILALGSLAYAMLLKHLVPDEYRAIIRLTHYSHYMGKEQYRDTLAAQLTGLDAA
jgi:hypothetical protein